MTQKYVFGQPVTREGLVSQIVRDNLDSLATSHEGPDAPLNPQDGMVWLDTSNAPTEYAFKFFTDGVWQTAVTFPATVSSVGIVRLPVAVANAVWTLVHNLGKPSVDVTLFDNAGKIIEAVDVDTTDTNQTIVTHAYAVSGSALVIG